MSTAPSRHQPFQPRIAPTRSRAWEQLRLLLATQGIHHATPEHPVVRPDGTHAPWVLDTLRLTLTAPGARLAAQCLLDLLRHFDASQLAVRGLTAVPLLNAVLAQAGGRCSGLLVRKEAKPYGSQKLIEGPLSSEQPVVVLDDSIVGGHSAITAVQALEAQGLYVEGVVCLVRFGWNTGLQWLESRGYKTACVMDLYEDLYPLMEGQPHPIHNPTLELPTFQWARATQPNQHPAVLARKVMEAFLRGEPVPKPARKVLGQWDHRGGLFVSVRPRADVTQRHARDGSWHFPGEPVAPLPLDLTHAAIKTASQFPNPQSGLELLRDGVVAVTLCGPLQVVDVGDVDNSRYGIVVRSRERPGWMGGALPNMPGILGDWEQLNHARTTNARLEPYEPFWVYRHTVERAVQPGGDWHTTGVPNANTPWHQRQDICGRATLRARELVMAALGGTPVTTENALPDGLLDAASMVFVTLVHRGFVQGCVGGPVTTENALVELVELALGDRRFQSTLTNPQEAVVTLSFLFHPRALQASTVEEAVPLFTAARHAVEVARGAQHGLLLPVVAQRDDLDERGFIEALLHKAGLSSPAGQYVASECVTWLADGHGARITTGGRPSTEKRPREHATLALDWARYLERQVTPGGEQFYLYYFPLKNTWSHGADAARAAHAAWTLARAGRLLRQPSLRWAARGVVEALARRVTPDGDPVGDVAFLLLALAELRLHLPLQRSLHTSLVRQLDEQGRVHTRTPGVEEQQAQDYFPGQLLLALATHPVDDDGKQRIGRALRRYVSRWQAQQSLGPVTWLMQALAAWSVLLEDRGLAGHCVSLGEWIMRWQLRSSGGFITAQQDDTPGFTTGVYLEGLAAAWCNGLVPAARRKVWRGALEKGLAFLDTLSLGPGDAPILPNADFARGGVCHGPHRPLVRLDYTSHALGAVLDLLEKD